MQDAAPSFKLSVAFDQTQNCLADIFAHHRIVDDSGSCGGTDHCNDLIRVGVRLLRGVIGCNGKRDLINVCALVLVVDLKVEESSIQAGQHSRIENEDRFDRFGLGAEPSLTRQIGYEPLLENSQSATCQKIIDAGHLQHRIGDVIPFVHLQSSARTFGSRPEQHHPVSRLDLMAGQELDYYHSIWKGCNSSGLLRGEIKEVGIDLNPIFRGFLFITLLTVHRLAPRPVSQ